MPSAVDVIEKERRIRIVQEWIIEDWPYQDIVNNVIQKWGVQERQAKRYIKAAKEKWFQEEQVLVDQKRRLKINSLKKLKRSLSLKFHGTPGGIRAILAVEKEIITLEGLRPATKVQLTGENGGPIQTETTIKPDLSKLSKEELKTIISLAKKAT